MSSGYSGTPLAMKLGIGEGMSVVTINAPKNYRALVSPLPDDAKITTKLPTAAAFVHVFATRATGLKKELTRLRKSIAQNGVVWVSWPRKSANVETDITEDTIRAVGLPMGFVDVKVCAVDETWSGLKLVIRKALRLSSRA